MPKNFNGECVSNFLETGKFNIWLVYIHKLKLQKEQWYEVRSNLFRCKDHEFTWVKWIELHKIEWGSDNFLVQAGIEQYTNPHFFSTFYTRMKKEWFS